MEAGLNEHVVQIEVDNLDDALSAYDSSGYKETLKVLGAGSVQRDRRVIEGAAFALSRETLQGEAFTKQ
jgi:hypothetical protein